MAAFPDSSCEMPAGVLSYIRPCSHKAVSAAAAACAKDRTSHQIFNSSHEEEEEEDREKVGRREGGIQGLPACLHDSLLMFK